MGLLTDDEVGELPCEPALDGTIAVVVTKVLAVRGCVPDGAGLLLELFCNPVRLMEGARGEEVGPSPELVGEIPAKLTGTVVVDAGELVTVVGI